ncbi:MAG: hypothetical protein R3Y08_06650 [Rikenellaceae bacterium]
MKKYFLLILASSLLLVFCSPATSATESIDPEEQEENQEPNEPETPEEPEEPETKSIYLEADGTTETYSLLNSNGFYHEVPDLGVNPEIPTCGHDFKHIEQVWDESLKKYVFALMLHVENGIVDTDRCKEGMEDRQRNEIKTYSESPATMYGTHGESHTYSWKFMLSKEHNPSTEFTHIHQIKAAGGSDDSQPLITFTTRASSTDQLQIVYMTPIDWDKTYIAKIDLDEIRGEWIQVEESLTYAQGGAYSLKLVRISDNKSLLDYTNNFDLWREDADLIRPKWGMYRKIYTDKSSFIPVEGLTDETIYFADFGIVEED